MAKRKKKIITPQDQVGGKVNSAIMFNMMPCESKVIKNDKGKVIPDKCDKCGGDIKLYLQGEPVYLCSKCNKYFGVMPFHLNEGKTIIISKEQAKNLKETNAPTESSEYNIGIQDDFAHVLREDVEWNENFNYEPYMKSLMEFLDKNGVSLQPYPKVILEDDEQEGLYIQTGYFNPIDNTIHVFIKNRHPKDVLRTLSHECIHANQFINGTLDENGYKGNTLKGDDELMKLESEAYLKGNIYFRKWTEECKVNFPQKNKKQINEDKTINSNIETFYRGYNSKYGEYNNHLLWLTDDLEYAKEYGDAVFEYQIDMNKCEGCISDFDDYFDYYDGPTKEEAKEMLQKGINSYCFYANDDSSYCMCLWDETPIVSKKVLDDNQLNLNEDKGIEEMDAYHGTSANFDKFDLNFISTGEGNQAYGYGIYVTTDRGTGEHYAGVAHDSKMDTHVITSSVSPWLLLKNTCEFAIKQNSVNKFLIDIIPFFKKTEQKYLTCDLPVSEEELSNEYSKCIQYIKSIGLDKVKKMDTSKVIDLCSVAIDYVNNLVQDVNKTVGKYLYTVDIPDDEGTNYIDWNGNLNAQFLTDLAYNLSKHFSSLLKVDDNKLNEYLNEEFSEFVNDSYKNFSFNCLGIIYHLCTTCNYNIKYSEISKQLSLAESAIGYDGIKVPTGNQQGGNGKGMNYVIFNVENIKIINNQSLQESNEVDEIVNPEDIDLSSFKIKKHLNPKFWQHGKLDSRIRLKLLDIADDFIDTLGIDDFEYADIVMTGSLANYNWSKKYSDIDLHIIVDFKKINDNVKLVKDYFDAKKKNWNDTHKDLTIMGFPVEVYIQDINEKHTAGGLYSLDKNKWITIPSHKKFKAFSNKDVKNKASYYMNLIDNLIEEYKSIDDVYKYHTIYNEINDLFDTIKNARKMSLSSGKGEFSEDNICFKTLRRTGYIEKLLTLKIKIYDKLMSVN